MSRTAVLRLVHLLVLTARLFSVTGGMPPDRREKTGAWGERTCFAAQAWITTCHAE